MFEKFIKFCLGGLLVLGVCVLVNIFLVEYIDLKKRYAYICVIITQILLGYILNRYFIFKIKNSEYNQYKVFFKYLFILLGIRIIDWITYTIFVDIIKIDYITMQIFNMGFFFLLKFFMYNIIFIDREKKYVENI